MEEKNNENTDNLESFFDEKPSDETIDSSLFGGEEISENAENELISEEKIAQEALESSFFSSEEQANNVEVEEKQENLQNLEDDFSIPQEKQLELVEEENLDNSKNDDIDKFLFEEDITDSAFENAELEESFSAQNEEIEQIEAPVEPVEKKSFIEEIDENFQEPEENDDLITVRPVKFKNFNNDVQNRAIKKNLDIMQDVSLQISVELGRTKSSIKEVMDLEKGSIVELDKIAGEQVEVFVNGKLVAKGEVIVIEDKFGVRVISTNISQKEENI